MSSYCEKDAVRANNPIENFASDERKMTNLQRFFTISHTWRLVHCFSIKFEIVRTTIFNLSSSFVNMAVHVGRWLHKDLSVDEPEGLFEPLLCAKSGYAGEPLMRRKSVD